MAATGVAHANTTRFPLSSGNFSQNFNNTGLITVNNDYSNLPSIVGYQGTDFGGATATTVSGRDPRTVLVDLSATAQIVTANQTNPNVANAAGIFEFEITDPVLGLAGSGTVDAPNLVVYLNATSRQNLRVSYRLRDLETGADTGAQQVALQYRVGNTGDFTNVDTTVSPDATNTFVANATPSGATAGPDILVSATLPSAVNGAADVQLRIITTNAAGNDQFVGVDDIAVTSDAINTTSQVPVANDGSATTTAGTPVTFTLTGSDPQMQALTFRITTQPANGTLTDNGNGSFTFTPNAGFLGTDTFQFTVRDTDNNEDATPATFTITVNEAPSSTVTTTQDVVSRTDGVTSFREAITFANANPGSTIGFNIPAGQATNGVFTLAFAGNGTTGGLGAPQPIDAANTTIDGNTQTTFGGNTNPEGPEILLDGAGVTTAFSALLIRGNNFVVRGLAINNFGVGNTGTNQTNAAIAVASPTTAGATPVTSGLISGNFLGTDADGNDTGQGNTFGVRVQSSASGVTISNNRIAFNRADGVRIEATAANATTPGASTGNNITQNSIVSNDGLGINLAPTGEVASLLTPNDSGDGDTGPNNLQNTPVITSSQGTTTTTTTGTLNSTPNSTFRIDIYANLTADNEGQSFLGSTTATTDGSGNATFTFTLDGPPENAFITATATNTATNDTSEFSASVQATAPAAPSDTTGALISEFRFRGPGTAIAPDPSNGATDEFVEILNLTDRTLNITGWQVQFTSAGATQTVTIANAATPGAAVTIPPRSHYLVANSTGYSLGAVAAPNQTFTADGDDGSGVTLLNAAGTLVDSAAAGDAPTANVQFAFVRENRTPGTGVGRTGQTPTATTAAFRLVATPVGTSGSTGVGATGDTIASTNGTLPATLGAPGPERTDSPVLRNDLIRSAAVDPGNPASSGGFNGGANRERRRDDTSASAPLGTIILRRTITNNTGAPITAIRFRAVRISTANGQSSADSRVADVRLLSSVDETVTLTDGTSRFVEGTTLEAPSTDPPGGGVNSSVVEGTLVLGTPLPSDPGTSGTGNQRSYSFRLGVVKSGAFFVNLNIEALPAPTG